MAGRRTKEGEIKITALLFLVFHHSGGCQSQLRKTPSPEREECVFVHPWEAGAGEGGWREISSK